MDLKTIGVGVAIAAAVGSPFASYFVTRTHFEDKITMLEAAFADQKTGLRTELNGMHQREQTLAEGLVGARNDVSLARTELAGELKLLNSNLAALRDSVLEIRGDTKRLILEGARIGGMAKVNAGADDPKP
jgi:hypothetical protein